VGGDDMTADRTLLTVQPERFLRIFRENGYCPTPPEPFGPCGLRVDIREMSGAQPYGSVIVTQSDHHDGVEWLHASIARNDRMPDYYDLVTLKAATFGDQREAYQVFPPKSSHISIHDQALHLWGRADGSRVLPDFGAAGTI
jgi:hypothetical protein